MLSVLSAVAPPIAPTSTSPNNTIDALLANSQTRAFSPLEDEGTFRTQWNIITTCFFTVVACAWVAIHPNVQCTVGEVNSTKWKRCQYYFGRILRGKIALVFIFLIFPEFIVAWAVSQCWMVNRAHWITAPGWTKRHTWFTMMGGFYIDNGPDLPSWPMDRERVFELVQLQQIRVPPIEEIDDKSKSQNGGVLSRALTLMQVAWFLVQCFVRATTQSQFNSQSQSLHISKLEILTLAYLMMTFWMYNAWWYKPLNVNRPIRLRRTPYWRPVPLSYVAGVNGEMRGHFSHRDYVKIVNDIVYGFTGEYAHLPQLGRVPTFYGGDRQHYSPTGSFLYVCSIAGMFAGIMCIAWSYEAPSNIELLLWRLSCLAGIGLVLQFNATFLVLGFLKDLEIFRPFLYLTEAILAWTMTVVYVIFRVMSIVLAVRELNTAPLGIFETIHWVELIPHV